MPLVNSMTLIQHAHAHGYGVAQVNTNGGTYDLVRAIVEVAEELDAPMILGVYEANLAYRGFEYVSMVMRHFAEKSSAPIAIHLDHGQSVEACQQAIDVGFTSVMIDGSNLNIDANIEQTKKVVALAKDKQVTVEAEVGELQKLNADGSMSEVKNLSDPKEVARISAETGIDMLAVGIGNAHGFYKGQPHIDLALLKELVQASSVPLVLHGTTGLADETVEQCVSMGMAKVNLGTLIRTRYVEYLADVIANTDHLNHPWRVCQAAKDRIKDDVRYIVRVTGSTNQAKGILACQTP